MQSVVVIIIIVTLLNKYELLSWIIYESTENSPWHMISSTISASFMMIETKMKESDNRKKGGTKWKEDFVFKKVKSCRQKNKK